MNKKELNKAFKQGLVTEQKYKDELFKLETSEKKPKKGRKIPTFLEFEEYKLLMKNTKRIDFKIAFMLGYESGLRLSEIVGLRDKIKPLAKESFNMEKKKITIEGGKGDVDRVVPLAKGFKDYMFQYFPLNKKYKTIASARRSLQKAFKVAARRAGLLKKKPKLHFHSLRHGFGSRLIAKGVPVSYVRDLMGHSNISTTNIYAHANPQDALDKYEELF